MSRLGSNGPAPGARPAPPRNPPSTSRRGDLSQMCELRDAARAFYNTVAIKAVVCDLSRLVIGWDTVVAAGARLRLALLNQDAAGVMADGLQSVPATAPGADEVHPEAVDVRLDLAESGEGFVAADALKHGNGLRPTQVSRVTCKLISIPRRNNLDPISVFVQDYGCGRGRIVVTCYGNAWQAFWGAMGDRTVMEFVAQCDADYVAGNMISGRQTRMTKAERAYTCRIAAEVIAEFRTLTGTGREVDRG